MARPVKRITLIKKKERQELYCWETQLVMKKSKAVAIKKKKIIIPENQVFGL